MVPGVAIRDGGNERAALLTGIQVARVKLFTYLASSLFAAVVGLIIASQLEAAHPATGESFELNETRLRN